MRDDPVGLILLQRERELVVHVDLDRNEQAAADAQEDYDTAVVAEDDALMTASNGREISAPAKEYLRELLGL